ncbi:MAG: 1,4-alpha-glucan branching protein GlgB [Candidatus Abyssobacteria bacterium SURF_5]|uniref:1,4-alpha-glucan branching enzyme GlgB n=1 Tax=Abyssobacteria bacterium (strain SURF_5) TaxID=2093360 RepID=A0A3A4NWY0_ABYX5|nr:MAG: 1,4-alpha-glucan branching protein GlgB [Candidatus Abyssubacteria bacterium SURF_5]
METENLLIQPKTQDIERLLNGEFSNPHAILGAHPLKHPAQGVVVRAFHPDAVQVDLQSDRATVRMTRIHPGGLFAAALMNETLPFDYRLTFTFSNGETWERRDPYAYLPTLGDMDVYLLGEGSHRRLYQRLGAHPCVQNGRKGVAFAVWAPAAKRVSIIGEFNGWDGRLYPMRTIGSSGVWELFVPDMDAGILYKYEIKTADGHIRVKTDPCAFAMEAPPKTASIVWDMERYQWHDSEWLKTRQSKDLRRSPMAIYEVHLGSWLRPAQSPTRWLTYRDLADKLVKHVRELGFTHIELLPIAEHPFDGSWGYQVTGYFAPTARFGTPDDFKYFVDQCHQNEIGVILDWVPAHFPKDDYSLRWFDGTALYEHFDPRQAEHKDWGTLIFNLGRNEVRNFLLANALFWLDQYHIDALRVDAVASMIYLDYSRNDGEWIPNRYGGKENLEAIEFLQLMNEAVYAQFPGCFTIAEESTDYAGVTSPKYHGGLGFGFKWNMGWMHDTLQYFSKDPVHRKYHHNTLTFSMLYAYSENFVLPLSHDEVVHGKGSLLRKMPGDRWQQFANLRLLLAYMFTHPGKKLLFMGTELAPDYEWSHDFGLDWDLPKDPLRQQFQFFLRDLLALYRSEPTLWERDHDPRGFLWITCDDSAQSVVSYIRSSDTSYLVCACNFTPVVRYDYHIGVPEARAYKEILNTDSDLYGGGNVGNWGILNAVPQPFHGFAQSLSLTLPPLGCLILEPIDQSFDNQRTEKIQKQQLNLC